MQTDSLDHRQRLLHALTGDRGVTTLQNVVVAPILLLFLAIFLHAGIILHANNIAHAAATSAYNAARSYNASSNDGTTAGLAVINQNGTPVSGASVSVNRGAQSVTVTVTGTAPSFVPGLNTAVDVTVTGPVERWVD